MMTVMMGGSLRQTGNKLPSNCGSGICLDKSISQLLRSQLIRPRPGSAERHPARRSNCTSTDLVQVRDTDDTFVETPV